MSARMKKTSQQSASKSSTPTRAASPARNRPPSPNWITRVQEKEDLANLNNRLAAYIDKVRSLETENTRLTTIVTTQEEATKTEITNIKNLYDIELREARKQLDDTAKAKTKADIENQALRDENASFKTKFSTVEKLLADKERLLLAAESQVNELQARLTDAVSQRKHWENEYNRVKKEKDLLEKRLKDVLDRLEEETLKRVDAENRLTSQMEENTFNKQVHEQEMTEVLNRKRVEIQEVDGRLQKEYSDKLADALREMREANDESIRINREESEETYERQIADLRQQVDSSSDSASRVRRELIEARRRVDELSSNEAQLTTQISTYEARIRSLESQLARQLQEHQLQMEEKDSEIQKLRIELDNQISEYRDLLEIKVKLDNEIASYRTLLEGEEARLNLSQTSDTSSPRAGTPTRQVLTGSSRKRRLQQQQMPASKRQMHSSSNVGFAQSSSAKGPVEISETDTDGKYIKLTNTSDKDQALGGWQLKHTADDDNDKETTFKFHRTLHVKPGATVTVWSAETEATHSPPTDLVMKGQKWFTADQMKSVLVNPQGEEMASRELKKSLLRTTMEFDEADEVRRVGEHWLHQQGEISGRGGRTSGAWGWSFFSFLK